MNWQHLVDLIHREMASDIVSSSMTRLLLAGILGGLIGNELLHQLKASTVLQSAFCLGWVEHE
ncbi:MAG: hypothetical protein LAP86_02470 [Acidobacteriia bacterium]|nr:hypothetical protein [Terriglobia bacterium]